MPQMHLVGKAARVLGRRRGVRVPRGASVWPAAVDATFLKKKQQCWRGKGGTKNKTENYAGTTKRHRQGHTGPALHTGPGRMTNGHVPLFHPWIEGES